MDQAQHTLAMPSGGDGEVLPEASSRLAGEANPAVRNRRAAASIRMSCPKCKSEHIRRSHRANLLEWLISMIAIYPYRCSDCHRRFLRFRRELPAGSAKTGRAGERSLQGSRAVREWKRRRRELLIYSAAVFCFLVFLYYITREHGFGSEGH